MNWFFLFVALGAMGLAGCAAEPIVTVEGGGDEGGAGGEGDAASDGGAEPVDTHPDIVTAWPGSDECGPRTITKFPTSGVGEALIICSACNDSCAYTNCGCTVYGAPCDAEGSPGVCSTCCEGGNGVLQCRPLD